MLSAGCCAAGSRLPSLFVAGHRYVEQPVGQTDALIEPHRGESSGCGLRRYQGIAAMASRLAFADHRRAGPLPAGWRRSGDVPAAAAIFSQGTVTDSTERDVRHSMTRRDARPARAQALRRLGVVPTQTRARSPRRCSGQPLRDSRDSEVRKLPSRDCASRADLRPRRAARTAPRSPPRSAAARSSGGSGMASRRIRSEA